MCRLCETGAKLVIENIMEGWSVHRVQDTYIVTWKDSGCPEPVFEFEMFIEDLVRHANGDKPDVVLPRKGLEAAASFRGSMELGYKFSLACIGNGWDQVEPAPIWFIQRLVNEYKR